MEYKYSETCRRWRQQNPERFRAIKQKWYNDHPEKRKEYREVEAKQNQELAHEMGIVLKYEENYSRRTWTPEEIGILLDNLDKSDYEIAKLIGTRSPKAVQIKRNRIGQIKITKRDP